MVYFKKSLVIFLRLNSELRFTGNTLINFNLWKMNGLTDLGGYCIDNSSSVVTMVEFLVTGNAPSAKIFNKLHVRSLSVSTDRR